MIGDRMMVAPLFAGEPSRKVVLPEGHWNNFWTGEALDGGKDITVSSTSEQIPVYVKSGSIIPWADVGMFAGAPETRRLTARIYGDGSLPCTVPNGKDSFRLLWRNGSGAIEGNRGDYDVYAWKQIG
jgi:alpha-glucosidase (family GH31 glycosyl hydrolase)